MKTYRYDEWDFEWEEGKEAGGFEDRIYIDSDGCRITGILEDFYCYDVGDNTQFVENGKISKINIDI